MKIKITIILLMLHIMGNSYSPVECQSAAIKVSCNLPLSGELSVYGTAIEEGVRFFQESLSEDLRKEVLFDWQDNEGKGVKTVSVARMQLATNPDIYVTGVKPQYMAIADILGQKRDMPNFAIIQILST